MTAPAMTIPSGREPIPPRVPDPADPLGPPIPPIVEPEPEDPGEQPPLPNPDENNPPVVAGAS
jgi:hypothetical protein